MRRTTTILLVGALVAVLAISGLAPAVSAHGGTDSDQPAPTPAAENATDAHAQYMAEWMATRMGPEGVEAFEEETGTTIETVAHAMVEQMGPQMGPWNDGPDARQYSPGAGDGYQAPAGSYGPQMPRGDGYGPGMWGGHGSGMWGIDAPGMWGGFGPGMWGGYGPGTDYADGGAYGPGDGGYGPSGGHGSAGHGHGMGGHGHGMGGGW